MFNCIFTIKMALSCFKTKFRDDAGFYLPHADVHLILYFTHQDASPVFVVAAVSGCGGVV